MKNHDHAVSETLRRVADSRVRCGLVLGGSIARGTEREDSDVDLFAIGEAGLEQRLAGFEVVGEKNGSFLLGWESPLCLVHVAYWPAAAFDHLFATQPYALYPWIEGRVVHDPDAVLAPYLRRVSDYFAARPRLTRMWHQQLAELAAHKAGAAGELAHPVWSSFNKHIAATVDADYLRYAEAEQAEAGDGDEPRA